jgi:hypothetical protein
MAPGPPPGSPTGNPVASDRRARPVLLHDPMACRRAGTRCGHVSLTQVCFPISIRQRALLCYRLYGASPRLPGHAVDLLAGISIQDYHSVQWTCLAPSRGRRSVQDRRIYLSILALGSRDSQDSANKCSPAWSPGHGALPVFRRLWHALGHCIRAARRIGSRTRHSGAGP